MPGARQDFAYMHADELTPTGNPALDDKAVRELNDGTLTELWIRCNNPEAVDAARDIIDRYAEARQYDETLTYSTTRRATVARP